MSECAYCNKKVLEYREQTCECGTQYCGFSCLAKSLHRVGINQHSFDELDRCGNCAVDKLKAGKLRFPQGDKHLNRLLAPHLLIHVIGGVTKTTRKKKVSENQMSLF